MISQEERLARRHGLELDLKTQEARRALLTVKLERAKVQASEAASTLKTAEARALQAEEDCASIRQLLTFDPDIINSLPVELLTAIWRELLSALKISNRSHGVFRDAKFETMRLLTPSRLAAVCRHWRDVALNTPELWTDVALRPYILSRLNRDAMMDTVKLRLDRSRPLALDLEICDPNFHPRSKNFLACMLPMLAQEAHRWRSLKVQVFPLQRELALLDDLLLGRQLPLLEELDIIGRSVGTVDAQWLRDAVALRSLSIHGLTFNPAPMLQFSAVVFAHIDVYMDMLDDLWSALSALPSLQNLSLLQTATKLETLISPTSALTLASLECLTLRGTQLEVLRSLGSLLAEGLSAPGLKRLKIYADALAEGVLWGPDFFAAFPTVVDLEFIAGPLGSPRLECLLAEDWAMLNCLRHIKSVSFTRCRLPFEELDRYGDSPIAANVTVDARRDWICHPPAYMWPELESFTISWPYRWGTTHQQLAVLLHFLRTRATWCSMRGKQFSFALLDWPEPTIPSWFRAAVGCLLGPSHVRLTTADGAVHAPVADDGEEEEPEAQFTDSDEESSGYSSSASSEGASHGGGDEWWVIESDDSQSESGLS